VDVAIVPFIAEARRCSSGFTTGSVYNSMYAAAYCLDFF